MRHNRNYWKNKEHVFEESKKYNSRSSFNKNSRRAYEEARKNKWLDEMIWLTNKNVFKNKVDNVYKYYFKNENAIYIGRTIDTSLRDKQHRTTINDSVYKFAIENNTHIPEMEIIENGLTVPQGISREIYWEQYYRDNNYIIINKKPCGGIGSMSKGKWSKKNCIEESKKYSSRNEFFIGNSNAYQKSLKEGWINEMTWLSNNKKYNKGYWSIKENVLNEARKYSSKKEFQEKNSSAFLAAHRYGFIKEMDWLIKQKQHAKNYWNVERIKEEASNYTTKTEFANKNRAAYNASRKLGIINTLFQNTVKKN